MEEDESKQVYHPNSVENGMGLSCFMSQERICGPDCMAYLPQPPKESPDYTGEAWGHCHLLVNAHRAGKHIVVIASLLKSSQRAGVAAQARAEKAPGVT